MEGVEIDETVNVCCSAELGISNDNVDSMSTPVSVEDSASDTNAVVEVKSSLELSSENVVVGMNSEVSGNSVVVGKGELLKSSVGIAIVLSSSVDILVILDSLVGIGNSSLDVNVGTGTSNVVEMGVVTGISNEVSSVVSE